MCLKFNSDLAARIAESSWHNFILKICGHIIENEHLWVCTKSTKKPQNRTTFLIIVKNHKKRKLQDFFLTLLRWGLYTVLQFLSYTVWQASLGCVCCWFALLSAEFFWLEHVFFMATRHWIMVSYSVSWIVSNLSWHKFPASSKKEK